MLLKINNQFESKEAELQNIVADFNNSGEVFIKGNRNSIKLFNFDGKKINIKSFKKPSLFNSIIYRYFRKTKARRSFEYANYLLKNNIGTPEPIAYAENRTVFGLKESYYISEQLDCDLTFRELVTNPDFLNHETILRQFTQFSFNLHQKGIEFLDHSPGNTLIKKRPDNNYDFYLVDLNRMKFHTSMKFYARMKNLCRLTPSESMIRVMSNEYAKLSGESEEIVFNTLWEFTSEFQYRFFRKKRLKRKLKFWR